MEQVCNLDWAQLGRPLSLAHTFSTGPQAWSSLNLVPVLSLFPFWAAQSLSIDVKETRLTVAENPGPLRSYSK